MTEGWHDISLAEYHAQEGISSSGFTLIAKSPAHYACREAFKETDAMIMGSAFHKMALEHDKFTDRYQVMEKEVIRSKGRKEEAEKNGLTLLKHEDGELLNAWTQALFNDPFAWKLIESPGPVEQSGFWKDPKWLIDLRIRPDKRIPTLKTLVDLKKISIAREMRLINLDDIFPKAIANFKYHWQAALYLEGASLLDEIEYDKFIWIVVTAEPPYRVGTYMADDTMLFLAREHLKEMKDLYQECLMRDNWPKPNQPGIKEISLPDWALKEEGR